MSGMSASLDELEGLISAETGEALYELALEVSPEETIVEIGSYKGKSTCYLAAGGRDGRGAHVWAIDPWDSPGNPSGRHRFAEPETIGAFAAQLAAAALTERVFAIRGFSVKVAAAWKGPPVGLLYIDGDHTEQAVRADVEAWRPHLAPGAVLAFDDLDTPRNPGVRVVVDELVSEGRTLEVPAPGLGVLRG